MSNQGLTPIIIDSISIKQDTQGRLCLNDLHKAAGGDPLQRPQLWLRNKKTQDLISEISSAQICAVKENQALRVINGCLNIYNNVPPRYSYILKKINTYTHLPR